MKRTDNRFGTSFPRCLAAAAIAGSFLPITIGTAGEAAAPSPEASQAVPTPSFGYSTSAWASPVQIEIYEPTIPIPATPQAELEAGYTEVLADSASTRGRASYLWPGAPIGEGFKTIAEQFGLPEQLAEGGYPIQVNAGYPSGNKSQSDEPGPGLIQRADATPGYARAVTGFSGDGEAQDPDSGGNGGGGGGGGLPGLPSVPGLSGGLTGLGTSVPASERSSAKPSAGPALPPELSALVDAGSFISQSTTETTKRSTADSRAHVGDVNVLGGLVTIAGITTTSSVSSDGKKGKADGSSKYGTLTALGQKFTYGSDGFEAVGQGAPIPGLPDDAVKALDKLGLRVSVPKPKLRAKGDSASSEVPGLVLDFDLTKLKKQLPDLPLADILDQIPDQAGDLKSLLQAAANLSPRVVYTLGTSNSSVDTSPPIDIPDAPETVVTPEDTTPDETTKQDKQPQAATPPGSSSSSPTDTAPPGDAAPASDAPGDGTLALPASADQAPGLPKLFSIPGMLLLGALLGAAMGGSYLRRLGVAALGGGSACDHGLDSGLPDLRKVL